MKLWKNLLNIFTKPSKLPPLSELPESYYVGQEFVEDPTKKEVTIVAVCFSPAILSTFEFFLYKKKVRVEQTPSGVVVSFKQLISKQLIDKLKEGYCEHFIIGYISKYLPRVNQEILKQRYLAGHFFVKPFSVFDMDKLMVLDYEKKEKIWVRWPPIIPSFPPTLELAEGCDEIYIRDMIDAGNAYFNNNYDDCIRRIITSVENTFDSFNLRKDDEKFLDILNRELSGDFIGFKTVRENLSFIYKVRNRIVHHRHRIKYDQRIFCDKAMRTLFYFHQFMGKHHGLSQYAFTLSGQFMMLHQITLGTDLERMEEMAKNREEVTEDQMIRTPQDMDNWMYTSLLITKPQQIAILKK